MDARRLATKGDLKHLEESLTDRMDVRFERLENPLTRRMITIMGAWTILVGSTVGWLATTLR